MTIKKNRLHSKRKKRGRTPSLPVILVRLWKKIKKQTKNWLEDLIDRLFVYLQGSFIEFVKTPYAVFIKIKQRFLGFTQILLGNVYSYYISLREKDRVWTYRLEQENRRHGIIFDILKHSGVLIYYLLLFTVLFFLFDLAFWKIYPSVRQLRFIVKNLTIPPANSIEIGLEIFIGAISAILGLIFALYSVGVQLTNDKYSEKVLDFIDQESVSEYFFSFLIFTDAFSILTLLRLHLFNSPPVVSFLFSSVLVIFSLLGILIFKIHYNNSLRPLYLFRSLWRLINEQVEIASNPSNYQFRSWSLVIYARNFANRYLIVLGDLFRDLIRLNQWNDASYAPVILGGILKDYVERKKLIDKGRAWWFFEKYERVKAEDLNLFTIKANYELQGKGPLHLPKAAENWLEDKAIELFEEIATYIPIDKSNKLAERVSSGYKEFLVGDYEERRGYLPKLIPGAIQNQEFDVFQRGLDSFFLIWKKIDFSKPAIATAFLNDYFAISEGLMEKWDIDKALKIAESFYEEDQLNRDKQFSFQVKLPTYTRNILVNYWERLEVEQELESKIVTPKERFIEEIKDVLEGKRKEIIIEYLKGFFDNSDQIIIQLYKQKNFEYVGHFVKMQYEWISRLLHLGDKEIAETFASRIEKNGSFVAYLPRQIVIDLELLEQAEKGFFVSLTKKAKSLFKVYARLSVLVLIIIRDQEKDQDKLFRLMKLPVIWGGITYLISELEQEPFYITTLTQAIEKSFRPGWMVEILEKVVDLKLTRDIWWETTRYHSWYATILNEMRDKLAKRPFRGIGEIGFSEQYDHPSSFVQQLAEWDLIAEERCVAGFLDWLRKREEIKKLVHLLDQFIKTYEEKQS